MENVIYFKMINLLEIQAIYTMREKEREREMCAAKTNKQTNERTQSVRILVVTANQTADTALFCENKCIIK